MIPKRHAPGMVLSKCSWGKQIEVALRRGNSPHSVQDLLRWLREGNATFAAAGGMTASVWFRPDGVAEIAHIAGRWSEGDADWLYKRLMAALRARGLVDWTWNGRPGWQRFLRLKGWI